MRRVRPKNQLFDLRQVLGLRQREMAEAIGVAPDTFGRYEAGTRRITPEMERKLAYVFGVEPKSLYSSLTDLWGRSYSRLSWESWKLLSEAEKEQVIDIEILLTTEIRRLLGVARQRGNLSQSVTKLLRILRAMAEDLDEPTPTRIVAFEEPITFVPKNPSEAEVPFRAGEINFNPPEE